MIQVTGVCSINDNDNNTSNNDDNNDIRGYDNRGCGTVNDNNTSNTGVCKIKTSVREDRIITSASPLPHPGGVKSLYHRRGTLKGVPRKGHF